MILHTTPVRVRYRDTDQMGVVHHAVYVEYLETGRTEMLRDFGMPYSSIEENGLMLPVLEVAFEMKRSAYYDDLLTVRSIIRSMPTARFQIDYEIFRDDALLVVGHTVHAFVTVDTMRPVRPPKEFLQLLKENMKVGG